MSGLRDVVEVLQKSYGDDLVTVGVKHDIVPRLPTGVFPFDLATGGGFPMGKLSIVYGPESSGKTNMCLKTIAMAQQLYPDHVCAFMDIENSFDKNWAAALGVDVEKLVYVRPNWGEQAVDMAHKIMQAGDLSLLVIDSLASLIPIKTVEDQADKAIVGGNAQLIQKLMYRVLHDMSTAMNDGRTPTVIAINQVRMKIGVIYGDPEKMPGGKAMEHASGLTVRIWGKNIIQKEIHDTVPAKKLTKVIIKKHKVPICNLAAEFEMFMIPHDGFGVGEISDWNTLSAYLKSLGWLGKEGQKWKLLDTEFSTIKGIRQYLFEHPNVDHNLRQRVITEELEKIYKGKIAK